jgi:hypothetical protein
MRNHVFRSVVWRTAVRLLIDVVRFALAAVRSRSQLAAENLFLRKQLAFYCERQVKPRRADDATRITLVMLSHLIDWRAVLTIVKPATLIRWHRTGFRLFWRWKSRAPGRPPLPSEIQQLIVGIAQANVTWGEERIAAELRVPTKNSISPNSGVRDGLLGDACGLVERNSAGSIFEKASGRRPVPVAIVGCFGERRFGRVGCEIDSLVQAAWRS